VDIIAWLKQLFKKENINVNRLINISDSFVMPTREIFKENDEMLKLIETYKAEYKNILKDKKLLFSMDLTNNINDDIRMYGELIANVFMDDDEFSHTFKYKIKTFYKTIKLSLYSEDLSKLYLECTARLVALLEIFNERKLFMSKHKKDALLFAINNLTNAIVVFEAQRGAIQIEKENYLNNHATFNEKEHSGYERERKKFIQEKVKILNRVVPFIGKKLDSENLSDLIILERELEIYVYKNKDNVESLRDEVSKLDIHLCDDTYPLDMNIFDDILNLERQVLIFYYFGKDLISLDELVRIYENKFLFIIQMDKNKFIDAIDSGLSLEYDCYSKLCSRKFEIIMKGKNPVISELFMENSIDAIRYIFERCSIRHGNTTLVGPSPYLAKFVFAFDSTEAFLKYLDTGVVKIEENELILGSLENDNENFISGEVISRTSLSMLESIFEWNDFMPKISLYELVNINGLNPDTLYRSGRWDYHMNEREYKLYQLYQQASDYYKLPEGIKKIDGNNSIKKEEASVFENIVSYAKGKRLVLPDSLEVFHGRIFPTCSISDVVLNDNIRSVSMSLLGNVSENLIIPASLETIVDDILRQFVFEYEFVFGGGTDDHRWYTLNTIGFNALNTITFQDYENSKLLQNRESLRLLFADTLYIQKSKKTWKLKTKVKTLVLIEGNVEFVYTIDLSDLEWSLRPKNVSIKNENKISVENVVIDEFMALVESKVSYRLNGYKTLKNHSLL